MNNKKILSGITAIIVLTMVISADLWREGLEGGYWIEENLEALASDETLITFPCYMPGSNPASGPETLLFYCLENTTDLHIEDCAYGFVPRQLTEECIFMVIYE